MTTKSNNPFVMPGMGQDGQAEDNPLMAGMEMMRQAMQGMANAGLPQSSMTPPMSLEELDRRLADLRTVENWLRMNLTLLSSSIQGFEVQRATIATLQSFMAMAAGASAQTTAPAAGRADKTASESASSPPGPADQASPPPMPAAAQGWWDIMQKQFDTLSAATLATTQEPETAKSTAKSTVKSASSKKAPGKQTAAARKRAPTAAKKTRA